MNYQCSKCNKDFKNSQGGQYVAMWNGVNWSELGGLGGLVAYPGIFSICIDSMNNIYAAGMFTNSFGKTYVAAYGSSVGINYTEDNENLTLYPNPCLSKIDLKTTLKYIGSQYQIIDVNGKVILKGIIVSETPSIELSTLPQGPYLFSILTDMKNTCRLIKE